MVSYGNHDTEAWYSPNGYGGEEARWTLPDDGPDKRNLPGVHSFVYGNTAIISLDPDDVSFEAPANLGISGGTRTTWFERQLKKFRASKDVDFVVNGHNHPYERTDVIKGDTVTKKPPIGGTAYPETEGVVYVTAGAAGRGLCAFTAPDSYEGHESEADSVASFVNLKDGKQNETVTWSRVRYLNHSFLRVDVAPAPKGRHTTLNVSGIAETGDRIDHFTVARRAK